ncbi:unnamed protein product, partial [Mesorhabditis spiculigera]
MLKLLILLIYAFINGNPAAFGQFFVDEGDVSATCPTITLAIGLNGASQLQSYLLGWLENIDYPKQSIRLDFHVTGMEEGTLKWWKGSVKHLFKSIEVRELKENWYESALLNARQWKSSRLLILPGNALVFDPKLLRKLAENKGNVVVPKLDAPSYLEPDQDVEKVSNVLDESDFPEEKEFEIESPILPLYLSLEYEGGSYYTFDAQNLYRYEGSTDALEVFANACKRMHIGIYASQRSFYGYWLEPQENLEADRWMFRYQIADMIAMNGAQTLPISQTVKPIYPEKSKLGFDQIYVINLEKRTEKRERVEKVLDNLGVEYQIFRAFEGDQLVNNKSIKINYMKNYKDPFHQRTMKAGEVGCFMSHLKIWEEVVANKLEKVIVFEDDIRVSNGGIQRIEELVDDLKKSKMPWDLIYLGRKLNDPNQKEFWVPENRHLTTIGYSYWTLGYMISYKGARKLLDAKPLEQMIPVDEFLPVMYGKHPNKEWASAYDEFEKIKAFAIYPSVVFPQRYTFEPGYISDTESSAIVELLESHGETSQHIHIEVNELCKHVNIAELIGWAQEGLIYQLVYPFYAVPVSITNSREMQMAVDDAAENCSMPYRAPELFSCEIGCVIDKSVDIWALGCCLYALCHFVSPFDLAYENGNSVGLAVLSPEKIPYPEEAPYQSSTLTLIRKMLVVDPTMRPEIAGVLAVLNNLICNTTQNA